MEKEKAKKTIQKRTCEKIGADSVEVLPPSACDPVGLPDDHGSRINEAVFEFLTYEIPTGADSLKDINQLQFSALCQYIGRKVNRSIIDIEGYCPEGGRLVPFSLDRLELLFGVFVYFVGVGGFVPFIADFFYFVGASALYIYSDEFQSSPTRAHFARKIKRFQEGALSARLAEGKGNPTGILAILNHAYGWTTATADGEKKQIASASVASLPDLSGDIVQIDQ